VVNSAPDGRHYSAVCNRSERRYELDEVETCQFAWQLPPWEDAKDGFRCNEHGIAILVPRHRGFDWLKWLGWSGSKVIGSTITLILRARPGSRRIRPERSRARTMPCTEGGVTRKCRCRSASAGGRPSTSV
jgi:hypothetical protein